MILGVADECNASLIVIGAKGLTDTPAFRLGSVTQRVMKHARVSVLLVRKRTVRANRGLQPGKTAVTIDRVLFATDGSKYANMASKFLIDLPLPKQSQVTIVTALQSYVEPLMMPNLYLETTQEVLADLRAAEESEAEKIIAKSTRQFEANGYVTTSAILRGAAAESILKAANEHDPDIIVVGSRGLGGVESFLLGSVSERVVRHAPCSVLIVKPPKK